MKYAPLILLLLVQTTSAKETWENDGPIGRLPPPSGDLLKFPTGRIDVYLAAERANKPAIPPMVAYPKAVELSTNPRDWPLVLNLKLGWSINYAMQPKGNGEFTAFNRKAQTSDVVTPILRFSKWRTRVDSLEALWDRLIKQSMHVHYPGDSIVRAKDGFKSIWIDGAEFKGRAALFNRSDGRLSTLFLLSNGQAVWVGLYFGPASLWKEALEILLSLKQNG